MNRSNGLYRKTENPGGKAMCLVFSWCDKQGFQFMVKVYGAFERKLLMVGFDAGQVIEIGDHRAETVSCRCR